MRRPDAIAPSSGSVEDWQGIGAEYFVEAVRQPGGRAATARTCSTAAACGSTRRSTATCSAPRGTRSPRTLDQPDDPGAALVAVDEYGQVKAMMGGRDFEAQRAEPRPRQAGRRLAVRPGRVVLQAVRAGRGRPAGHLAQLEVQRAGPASPLPGANAGEDWKVSNYGGTEQGVLDLVDATRVSSNTAYAQLMLEVGPEAVVDLAGKLGRRRRPARPCLARARHRRGVGARHGHRLQHLRQPGRAQRPDRDRQDRAGRRGRRRAASLDQATPSGERVLTEEEADLVTYCLRQVVQGGTGAARRHRQAGGGQDRHDAGQPGRLVRRLHAEAHRRGVDGLRRRTRRRACRP